MLGLIQCARKTGFDADGYEADIQSLKESKGHCHTSYHQG